MKYSIHSIILSFVVMVSGCATIVTGSDQTLTFNSEPDGATVTVAGLVMGKTPLSVSIDKDQDQTLTFEKEGYETYTTQLSTSTNPWFFGNIIIGGLIGSTTDGLSGAIHEFSPDQYFITLKPETPFGVSTSKARQVKELTTAFGGAIRKELVAGEGESADALLAILEPQETEQEATLNHLQELASANPNDLDFATAVIEHYKLK